MDGAGTATYRIGTTSALAVNLEECSGCGIAGWGWQDTGWGVGALGPEVIFGSAGTQRMRVQTREDGFAMELLPDCRVIQKLIDKAGPVVQVGAGEPL